MSLFCRIILEKKHKIQVHSRIQCIHNETKYYEFSLILNYVDLCVCWMLMLSVCLQPTD